MPDNPRQQFSAAFLLLAVLFTVCLVVSNLFATKVFTLRGFTLTGAEVVFPITYVLGDCFAEVWGFRKTRFVIWTAFGMNLLVTVLGKVVTALPGASFWDGAEHFTYIFNLIPRMVLASLLAFLAGSTLNAFVLSKMKALQKGKGFSLRAIASSLAGETLDSLVFMPIAFFGVELRTLTAMVLFQIGFKVLYEILVLPLTATAVKHLKKHEGIEEV